MSDDPVTKLDQVGYRYLVKQSLDVNLDQVQYRYLVKSSRSVKLDQLQYRYLVKQSFYVNLDQVGYRYLVKQSLDLHLDQVQYRYLVKDNTPAPLDYTKTPHQYILDGIKNEMYLPVKERYISFSHPTPDDTVTGFNSTVRMNVTRDSGFKGYATLSYVRPEISDLVVNRDIYENFKPRISDIETTHDMLEVFNDQFDTKVPVDEIIDSPVDLKQDVVFTASNDSFFWVPGTTVSLGTFDGADRYRDLELGTFTMPQSAHTRLDLVSKQTVRYVPTLATIYNQRRI